MPLLAAVALVGVTLALQGPASAVSSPSPVAVTGTGTTWTAAAVATSQGDNSATSTHSCAVTSTGGVKCWGYNANGQLGNNSTSNSAYPVNVTLSTAAGADPVARTSQSGGATIAVGQSHSCVIVDTDSATGTVQCWGTNDEGQLGNGSNAESHVPVVVKNTANTGNLTGVLAIAAGSVDAATNGDTCAVNADGGVACWGENNEGELGLGTTGGTLTDRPVQTIAAGSSAVGVTVGFQQSCAWFSGGGAKCWGSNSNGQIGDGTTTNPRPSPTVVKNAAGTAALTGVTAMSTGYIETCAVVSGGAMCWGYGGDGQIGIGSTAQEPLPTAVSGLGSGVTAIGTGSREACAVVSGGVKCWGSNQYSAFGSGNTTNSGTPVSTVGVGEAAGSSTLLSGVSSSPAGALSVGSHVVCTRATSGAVTCWGRGDEGAVGDGYDTTIAAPTYVNGTGPGTWSAAAVSVSADRDDQAPQHACAVDTTGAVRCWGYGNDGQLANGGTTSSKVPVDVLLGNAGGPAPVARVSQAAGATIASNAPSTCVIVDTATKTGTVQCWGKNTTGNLGDGTNTTRRAAVNVVKGAGPGTGVLEHVTAIAAGSENFDNAEVCAIADGGVFCWGYGTDGRLGNGATGNQSSPVQATGLPVGSGVVDISVGPAEACAVTATHNAKCWGYNNNGQLGDNTTTGRTTPTDVVKGDGPGSTLLSNVSNISVGGYDHTCAVASGSAYCWGNGTDGEVGDGTNTTRHLPTQVSGLTTGVDTVSAGSRYSCAVMATTGVECWGRNDSGGELGNGGSGNAATPTDVLAPGGSGTLTGVSTDTWGALATGGFNACARLASGGLDCWGYEDGTYGNLGHGQVPAVPGVPTAVGAVAGSGQATVSWTAPASIGGTALLGYRVTPYIGGVAQPATTYNSTAVSEIVPGLTNGTTYTFTVAAINGGGSGGESSPSAAATPIGVPGAPTGVTGTAGDTQVALSWTAPGATGGSPITGYRVTPYIGATAQTAKIFNSTATAQSITGLTNGTAYTFKVAALNLAGASADSTASAALTPAAVPGPARTVTGTPGDSEVVLSWLAPTSNGGSAVTGYRVTPFVGASAQAPVVFNSALTTETITGLTNGTAYTFTVAATNATGTGTDSTPSAAITPAAVPGAPTGVSGTAGDGQVSLSWIAPTSNGGSAVTGYRVTPYIGATAQAAKTFNSTATTQAVTGLTNGTTYTFKVAAINAAGTGADSDASGALTPTAAPTAPGAPTGITGTSGDGQVTLQWTAPANGGSPIASYRITPFVSGVAQPAQTFDSADTSEIVTGLVNGTAYTFTVAAINAIGTGADSLPSAAVTPHVPATVPGAPTSVAGSPGDTQVTLSWMAPASDGGSPITGYVVTPLVAEVPQAPVTFNSPALSQQITGLVNGTAYTFTVAAINGVGTGPASAESPAVTPTEGASATVPGAPSGVSGVAGNAQAVLSWVAPASGGSAITGYRVTPYIGAVAQAPQTFNSSATTEIVTGLTNGTAYTFTVAAINGIGTGADSVASSAVTPAPPWAPFASWSALVKRQYQDILGRAPTTSELNSAITSLNGGAISPGGLVAALETDPDFVGQVAPIVRLYTAYFLRIPDAGGLTYWIAQHRNGRSLDSISDFFSKSAEFKSRYGSLSNQAFVERVYLNVLGRAGDSAGIAFWTSQLDQKKKTRGQVMIGFSESAENKRLSGPGVTMSTLYILLLGRAPTTTEYNDGVAALQGATTTVTALANGIIHSAEYATHIAG